MVQSIPTTMLALRQHAPVPEGALSDPDKIKQYVSLETVPVPEPGPGQVLVKVSRGSLNPNDLYHIKGVYSSTFDYPYPRGMGFEGAGVVVASGKGWLSKLRQGKRVSFYSKNGLFAEYVLADAMQLIVLPEEVGFKEAASSVANPITGTGMARWAKQSGSEYFFITAAAGVVATMTMRVALTYGLKPIAIIRRDDQAEVCWREGASYVLNQNAPDFQEQLAQLCAEVNCTYGFDSIGGHMPLTLMRAMPQGSTLCMYGYFDTGPMQFEPQKLFNGWKVDYFETEYYLASLSMVSRYRLSREVVNNINGLFQPRIQRMFALKDALQAYTYYTQNMSAGKVQIIADFSL